MITITINSVDRTADIEKGSIELAQTLSKEPATFRFIIKGLKNQPTLGQEVILTEGATNIFRGTLIERHESAIGNVMVGYEYLAVDGYYLLDRKLVSKAYNNQTAGQVVQDIIDNFVTGITTDITAVSPNISTARFNYEQPSRCIQKIANQIGWDWYIDASNVLHFFPPDDTPAPFDAEDDNDTVIANSLKFDSNITELKNIIYVRGGEYLDPISEDDAVDKYEADGSQDAFPLIYRYNEVQVTLNGVAKQVGVDFLEQLTNAVLQVGTATSTVANELRDTSAQFVTNGVQPGDQVYNSTDDTYAIVVSVDSETALTLNKDIFTSGETYNVNEVVNECLYNYQEKSIRFPRGTLLSGDLVKVFGNAFIPLIVRVEDQESIVAYGEREGVEIDKTITSITEAELLANALLSKWREGSKEGKFRTRQTGLQVGQSILINSTRFGINQTYKVNRIRGAMTQHDEFEYTIEFITSGQTTLSDILIDLIGRDRKNVVISPDEVIQRFRNAYDEFSVADELVEITVDSAPYHYGPVTTGNEGKYNFATYT